MKVRGLSKVNSVFMFNNDWLESDSDESVTEVVRLESGETRFRKIWNGKKLYRHF